MDSEGAPVGPGGPEAGSSSSGEMASPDKALFGYLVPLVSSFVARHGAFLFWGGLAVAILLYNVWDHVLVKYYTVKMALFPGPQGVPKERLAEVEAERRKIREAQQKRLEAESAEAALRRAETERRRREERLAEARGVAPRGGHTLGGGGDGGPSSGPGPSSSGDKPRPKAIKGLSQRTFAQMKAQDPEWNQSGGRSGYRPSTKKPSGGG